MWTACSTFGRKQGRRFGNGWLWQASTTCTFVTSTVYLVPYRRRANLTCILEQLHYGCCHKTALSKDLQIIAGRWSRKFQYRRETSSVFHVVWFAPGELVHALMLMPLIIDLRLALWLLQMRLNMVRACAAQLALRRPESSKPNALRLNAHSVGTTVLDSLTCWEVSAAGELPLTNWVFSQRSLRLLEGRATSNRIGMA